ncbi:filamentous hemagglutinin N-terminal domain-containing protein [Methyloversatilis sp.]|uniref:filamentous hemagglutinin N-terminal domain-containing protein n=1 Tax=Methyloversatilis sp. TaxID=2569862 RepID=UPI003D2BCCAF
MNKGRYRLVYSDEHRSYVPVPEETCARGKNSGGRALRRLVAAMAAALPGLVIANPTGHQIVQGQVGIQTQGSTLNITASDRAIINWKQFSIQPGETTRFIQPHSTATVLNRVVGQDPSQILGNLIANGRVFLINPNGVLFGAGAKVNTAGLVASTLNISNEDFTAGRLKFKAEGAAGKLRNEGTLKATGGPLLLIATDIENTGLITADNGDIVLAAGKSVEIADPHQPALRVRVEAGGEAINLGQLIARGGNVGMFGAALTQAGKISATGAHRTADGRIVLRGSKSVTLTAQSETTAKTADGAGGDIDIAAPEVKVEAGALVDASGTQGGRIDIAATQKASADGTLRATGTLPAAPAPAPAPTSTAEDIELPATGSGPAPVAATSEAAGKGGQIEITADTVLVGGTATLDASGDTGGGSVLVGGDWQGANPQVRNAQVSWIGSGARLLADALFEGDGGKVVVWADQATAFHGNIWARGGRNGGNGGQVEVSGKVALLYRGRTDTSAARGRNGVLLLDPLAMVIQGGSGDGSNDGSLSFNGGAPGTLTAEALGPTVIYESEIEEQSKTTDIILRAQRSVTVGTSQFSYTGSGNAAGETSGQLTLAEGSSLLIETRNLGAGEGGASAGIDLVTGGWHGAGLRVVTQGDGSITMQTGYSNGSAVGDQRADIVLPVLRAANGGILIRAGGSSTVDLRGSSYDSGAGIDIEAGTVTGGVTFNAADGTYIDGDYSATSGTLTFNGGASSISGRLTLAANLGGNAALTLGDLLWQGGQMLSGATTTLTGSGLIDDSAAYRYLDRRLDVTGQLEFANSAGYDLYVRDGGRLNISAGGSVGTAGANGFLRLAASAGTATFSAESGASLSLGDGTTFSLSSDNSAGNLIAGNFTTIGNGVLLLAAGRINTGADTTFSGSGSLRLANSGVIGGSHVLTLGTLFDWRGGSMDGSGSTVLSGNGLIDNSNAYRYLQRTLRIDGTLTLDNPTGYDLRVGNDGHLHIGSTGTLATGTTNGFIYMQAGTGGTAVMSADAGGRIAVADGTLLTLRSDSSSGNQLSGTFDLDGAGVLHLDSGALNVDGTTIFGGDGSLRMSGGATINGSGVLTIASDFDWRGGRFGGSGTTFLTGDAVIDNTSAYKYVSRRIEVSGNLTFGNSTGYDLRIENGGALHLASGGRLSTSSSGLIYMQAGSGGNAAFSAAAGSAITVGTGTMLTLRSDGNAGNTLGGQYLLDGAGALHIDSGLFTTAAPTTFGGTGLLRISGGTTLNIDHASTISTQFRFEGGTLAGSGNLLISGPMTWAGGTLAGSGTTTVSGTTVIDNTSAYKYLSRRLVIAGNLEFGNSNGYYLQINNGGTLHLGATGRLFTTAASGLIYMAAGSGGTATFSADDGARLDAASGFDMTLRSDGNSGNRISGSFELGGSGDLHLDSGVIGTGAASRFDGSGRLRLSGGATFNANHALTIDSAFRMEGGTLGGSGNVNIGGAFTWAGGTMTGSGTTTVGGSGTIDNTSAYKYLGRRLDVTGSLAFGNTSGYYLQLNNGGHLHVAAGGALGTSASNGLIYLASGSGGSALFSADADGDIVLGAGTELTLRADGNVGNRLAGSFDLNGEGRLHLDSGMVSVDTDSAFTGDGRLLLSGGGNLAGSAVLSIASAFDWTGGGSMSGSGTTRLLRDVTLSGSGTRTLNRTLEIAAGRTLAVGDGVALNRSTSSGGSGGIVALGLFTKSAGSGTASVNYLDIRGNLSASSGILSLTGNTQGTSLGNAAFSTSGSGSLRLDSGLFTLTNGQTTTFASGNLELHGATLSTAGNASIVGSGTFRQVAGTLDGAGTLTIASGFDWTGGTMSGSGTTRLATSASLSGNATRTLNRTLEIAAGHTLNLGDDVLIQRSTSNGGSGGIVALGTVSKSAGSGVSYIRYLDLRGNFTAGSGVLSIYGNTAGSSIAGAVFSSTGNARVRADSGLLTLNSGESASISSGLFELSGATLSTSGNSAINGAGMLSFTSGFINGVGTLSVNTGFDWSSGTMGGSGITRLNGSSRFLTTSAKTMSRTLEIAGTTRTTSGTSGLQIQDGGRLSVLASGEFEVVGGTGFTFSGSGRIDNAGLLRKTGTAAVTLAMPLTNSGTLRVEEGVLTASAFPVNAGTLDVFNGATLIAGALQNDGVVQGSGTINLGSATLTNAGTLRPGGDGSAGTLTLTGHYAQTASGIIEADVLGTLAAEQDHLVVSGNAALDGDLRLAPSAGLSFGAQDRYTVLSCGADGCLSGTFDTVDSGTLGLTATSFSNAISFATGSIASTWIAQSSGFWDIASNWAGGFIPGAQNDVVIDQAGDLTITVRSTSPASTFAVNSLYSNENIVVSGSTLTLVDDSVINGRLTVSGGTLNIGTQLETGALTLSGGTISGGRLITGGSGSVMSGGTLSALQLMIGTQLRATGGTLNNVTLSRSGNSADAGKVLIADNGDVRVVGALTLDNAEITLASSGSSTYLRGTAGAWSINGNGSILFGGSHNAVRANNVIGYTTALTLGSGVTVSGPNGGYIYFGNGGVNNGTISADTAGKNIEVNGWNASDAWSNAGTLRANGGILSINDTWSSSGSLRLDAGTMFLAGSFNTASFNTLVRPADADRGTLNLVGVLNNAGSTLLLNGATGTLNIGGNSTSTGLISGGTVRINNADGGALNTGYAGISGTAFGGSPYAVLSNVTLANVAGVANSGRMTIADNGDVRVVGALTLDNAEITLASSGSSTYLRGTAGAWSINGNGSILFGGSHNAVRANNVIGYTTALTLGSGVTVAGPNGGYVYFGNGGVNNGTISADTAGKNIEVNGWNASDAWSNAGTLRANGGILSINDTWSSSGSLRLDAGTMFLAGSFNTASFNTLIRPADADRGTLNLVGVLNNTGSTLLLNGATGTLNIGGNSTSTGLISGGTVRINNADGGALNTGYAGISGTAFGGSPYAVLSNVTLANVAGVANSGRMTIADNGDVRVVGALTLDNAEITLASSGSSTYLRGTAGAWSINGNGSILFGGSHNAVRANNVIGYTTALTLGSGVTVAGPNGGYVYFGNGGVNNGTISADTAGKNIEVNGWNASDAWSNAGTLRANGGILSINDTWSSSGSLRLDAGTMFLAGSFNTASFNTLIRPADADRGTLNLVGVLNNTGSTLLLNGATGTLNIGGNSTSTGLISGGTVRINNADGGALNTGYAGISGTAFGGSPYAVLSNVTLANVAGVANSGRMTIADNGDVRVVGALTLDNAEITLASSGSSTYLRGTAGAWSINGNGSILFGGSHNAVRANNVIGYTTALTLGSGVTVSGPNGGYIYFGNGGVNNGTIVAGSAGKEISLNSWNSSDVWTNAGTLHLAGGRFHAGDSFINTGLLRGAGNVDASGRTLTNSGTIFAEDGVLNLTGNLVLTASGTLRFDIGGVERGTGHGALDVNGTLTFGGTLQVAHTNGFTPDSSEAFPLIRYTTRSGTSVFAALNVPAGFGYDSFYGVGTYLLATGEALPGEVNEWVSNSNGDWSTGTNWSLGFAPNSASMSVLIDRVGYTPTVTLSSGTWTVGELISQEHLTISGGSLTVVGETAIAGNLTLNGSGQLITQGPLDLNAVTLNSSSAFMANTSGHIASFVQNNGTSTFAGAGLAFDAIDIRGGTVNYNAALALPSSLLRVAGHTANLNADQGQTRIEVVSGTLNLNLSSVSSDIALSGGTLNVAGATAASGDFDWTGGNIGGGGTLTLSGVLDIGGGSNSFGLNDTTLVHTNASGNSRIAKTGGYFYLSGSSELRNAAGAVLTVDTSGGNFGTYYSSGAGGTLHNQGTLNKTGGGALYIYNPTRLQQAGQLNLQQGSIIVQGGSGHLLSGNTTLADGTALQLTSSHSSTISATARFAGDGQLLNEGGTLTLADGARIDVAYTQASGTLSLTGSATMNDDFVWNSGTVRAADLVTAGTLTLNGAFIQSGNTTVYLRDGLQMLHTNTAGESRIANASSSGFNVENGAVFRNTGVLTLDTAGAGSIMYIDHDSGSGGRFENAGTLVKSGEGRVDFGSYGSLAFDQNGSFAVNAGTVEFGGTSIALGGSMTIADNARVLVRAGSTTTASGFAFNGGGVLAVGSGTLVLGHGTTVATDLELSGGTLSIGSANTAEVTGDLSWTGGTINGGGTLTQRGRFLQTGNTTVYLRDGTLLDHVNSSGASRIANTSASGFNLENGAVFRNSGVLRLDVAGSGSVMYIDHDAGSAGSFVNTGTLIKSGSGRLDFGSFGLVALTQSGTLQIEQGRVTLGVTSTGSPAHLLAGSHVISGAGSLEIVTAPGTTVTANATATATFSGSGPLVISGGTLMLADGLDLGITVRQSGGHLAGSGSNELSGRYEWTGGDVSGSGTLTVSGVLQISGNSSFGLDGRSMVHTNASGNSSLYKPGGYFYLGGNATFTNAAGATLYIDTASNTNAGAWYQSGSAGSFVNAGTLVKQGNGTFNFWSPIRFINTGSFTVAQGAVMADGFTNNPGVLQLLSGTSFSTSGSALTSTGTIAGHGSLIVGSTGLLNRGVVAPGGANSIGTLRITGQYVQAADGTLQIERGSAGTDALIVSGAATLGGTLAVTQLAGYQPTALQTDIVSANTLSGSFASVTLPSGYSTLTVGNRHVLSYAGAICGGVCWDGGAGTLLWTDAANWTTDLLPGITDLVFIDLENGVNVQLTGGAHTISSLTTTAGNTLTISGGTLTVSGGANGQAVSTLAGDLTIGGGSFTANAQTSIARLLLSSGSFGGSGAVTFTGTGSSWTGGDMVGSGSSIFAAGSTFEYAAGTRSSTRRVDIRQGATVRNASGSMTLTGGAANAGVIDVALGATVRYGGSASYLLDATGQFDGGGRIEFIDSAMATAASTAAAIADGSFTVRVQDSARFTMTAPTSIANLELAGNGQVIAQAGFQAANLTQTGGTLTVNAASAIGRYNWNGGTFAGSGSATLTGQSGWTRGTLTGNLVVANGATLTLSTTGSDDVQGTSYKRFGAGSLSNFGTLAWQEGHIDVVGNARVNNAGLVDITGNFSFGDRSVGVGTLTLNNLASGTIRKSGGGETSIGTLGIPGGTANYANVINDGDIMVESGSLRFGIGYSGAPGGGTFVHNGRLDVVAGALLEFGGSLTHNGSSFIDSGATLRRIGGFTNAASGLIEGFGTVDVGAGNTLRNDGTMRIGDLFNGVYTHGTMRVTGNYVQGSGGQLLMAIGGNAAGEYDQLAVSGSATLGGALVVSEAPGYVRETVAIDLITTGAGVSSSFATVTLPDAGYTSTQSANALRLSFNAIACGGICWDGGAGTNLWTDAANWTGNVLPGLNDLVFISLASGGQVMLTGGDQRIAGLNTVAGSALTITGGALTITGQSANGSVASAVAGDLVLSGGTLNVGGQASFAGLRQSGGFSQFDGNVTVSRLALSGGEGVTLRTNGSLTVSDTFDWRDQADLDGAGIFTTAGLTTATGSGGLGFGISVDWHNSGTLRLASGALLHFYSTSDGDGGALINEADGVIDLSDGNALALGTHSGPLSRFVNAGTLIKGGGGEQRLEGNYSFDNLGSVQVNGGRLDIRVSNADRATDTGRYTNNATLAFGAGRRTLGAGSDIDGAGTVEFSGAQVNVSGSYTVADTGTTRINAGRADFAQALNFANTLTVRGGVLNFNGSTRLNRLDMDWVAGDLANYSVLGGTGTLTFTGSGSTIADGVLANGIVNGYDAAVGPLYVQTPSMPRNVTIASGASLNVGGQQYADLSGIALNNQGRLSLVNNIHLHGDNTIDNAGLLEMGSAGTALGQVADVAWNAPGSLLIRNSGTLEKRLDGSSVLAASLQNAGTIDLYAGALELSGNYEQGAGATLVSRIGFGTTGRLQVGGTATLAGTLEVSEAGGYSRVGVNTNIVQADGGLIGRFTTQRLPADYTLATSANRLNLRYMLISCGGICWDGGGGTSNWMDAANWTGDALPGLNDLVFINLAGGANVVLNANPALTLAGLTIGDANSLTLTGGTLNAPTTILNGGTLSLTGGTLNFGDALNNAGTLNYAGGALTGNLFTNSGTLNVLPGSGGNLTTTRLNNTGSIVVNANRTVEFGSGGGMIFANDGDVQVRSGTLSVLAHDTDLSGPRADSGDYTVDAGATLRFRDAFRDFGPGSSITGAGDVEFTAFSGGLFNVNGVYSVGGTTRVSGNTLVNFNSNASFGSLAVAGNIGGTGTLTVAENLVWTSGSIGGAGRSVIVNGDALLDGASLNLAGARLTIADSGLIDAGTRVNMSGGAQLIVATGASLGVGSNAAVGGSGSLVNRGTLEGTVGGGSSNIGVLLSNFGEVSASSGNLGLTGGIANTGAGSFVIGADATMELGGDLPPDIFDRIGGAGTLSFSPTSQPVINRSYAAQGGTPFSFSLRSGAVLTGLPQNGTVSGEAAGWIYTANAGFNGTDSARFTLSLGSGTAVFNISFAVTSEPAVTQPQVQVIATTLLPEVFQPPRIVLPATPPQVSAPINVASVDALSDIATASGPQFDQPLRDFRASRLQCR